jgi:hypothetical protein
VRVWRCRGGSWSRRRATFGCRLWWARSWQRGLKAECGREARRRGNLTAREAPLSQVRCPPAVVVFGVRGRRWQRKEPAPAGKRRVEYSRRAGGGGHKGAEGQRGVLQPQNLRRHRRSRPASLWPWREFCKHDTAVGALQIFGTAVVAIVGVASKFPEFCRFGIAVG